MPSPASRGRRPKRQRIKRKVLRDIDEVFEMDPPALTRKKGSKRRRRNSPEHDELFSMTRDIHEKFDKDEDGYLIKEELMELKKATCPNEDFIGFEFACRLADADPRKGISHTELLSLYKLADGGEQSLRNDWQKLINRNPKAEDKYPPPPNLSPKSTVDSKTTPKPEEICKNTGKPPEIRRKSWETSKKRNRRTYRARRVPHLIPPGMGKLVEAAEKPPKIPRTSADSVGGKSEEKGSVVEGMKKTSPPRRRSARRKQPRVPASQHTVVLEIPVEDTRQKDETARMSDSYPAEAIDKKTQDPKPKANVMDLEDTEDVVDQLGSVDVDDLVAATQHVVCATQEDLQESKLESRIESPKEADLDSKTVEYHTEADLESKTVESLKEADLESKTVESRKEADLESKTVESRKEADLESKTIESPKKGTTVKRTKSLASTKSIESDHEDRNSSNSNPNPDSERENIDSNIRENRKDEMEEEVEEEVEEDSVEDGSQILEDSQDMRFNDEFGRLDEEEKSLNSDLKNLLKSKFTKGSKLKKDIKKSKDHLIMMRKKMAELEAEVLQARSEISSEIAIVKEKEGSLKKALKNFKEKQISIYKSLKRISAKKNELIKGLLAAD
ncbi:hypothetical protein AAMO2058_000569400 [Amorphochlora amoebiformis]